MRSSAIILAFISTHFCLAEEQNHHLKFFENEIRPLLVAECFECHDESKSKGGLRLDHIDLILNGGDSGPALVPGRPGESLLIEGIHRLDPEFEMPPKTPLGSEQIAALEKWITEGAFWPDESFSVVARDERGFSKEDRDWWAIQPLAETIPPQTGANWAKNDIDRYIARKLEEQHLSPAPSASATELIRRIYFDLHGLPPSPENVDTFTSYFQQDEDAAVIRLVDQLLASPRYGERWGQHWLDAVRYAESDGYRADDYRPETWRYRDYVIRSFNEDKPYDEFVIEQLAADEIAPNDPDKVIATAFLRLGIYEWNQRNARMQWDLIMTEMTNVTGEVFLGIGIGCAQCHDHKFDPILQKDYFALQAFLNSTWWPENAVLANDAERSEHNNKQSEWDRATAEIRRGLSEIKQPKLDADFNYTVMQFPEDIQEIYRKPNQMRTAYEKQLAQMVQRQIDKKESKIDWEKELAKKKNGQLAQFEKLTKELAAFNSIKPRPLPSGFITTDVGTTAANTLLKVHDESQVIEPAFLTLLDQPAPEIAPTSTTTGRRTALAKWITKEDNPLSTRVIVNRLWQHHFGTGLVPTPNDFGNLGEKPSHPELLDWLTLRFLDGGWRMKSIHRLIMNSAAYRQTARSEPTRAQSTTDPDNRLLWRFSPKRLDAEQIRDSILAVSGELGECPGGPSTEGASVDRSIYLKKRRNTRDDMIGGFDAPSRFSSAPTRLATTSPTQSLMLVNSEWTIERARIFAERLLKQTPHPGPKTIHNAYKIAYGRMPDTDEVEQALSFIEAQSKLFTTAKPIPYKYPNETGQRPTKQAFQNVDNFDLGEHSLWLQPGSRFQQLQIHDTEWPEDSFSVEAIASLDKIYSDASVNTLLSRWNGSHVNTGWTLGITSEKSRHQPRNFIMQLVGDDFQANRIYEVVASNLRVPVKRPVYLAACVSAVPATDGATQGYVTFSLKDLSDPASPLETTTIPHQVVGGLKTEDLVRAIIGGRDQKGHLWDGQLSRLVVSRQALTSDQLLVNGGSGHRVIDWNFSKEVADSPAPGTSWIQERPKTIDPDFPPHRLASLTDFCQALISSNEFLYLH